MAKTHKMKLPKGGKHRESHVKLHRPKMSSLGKSAFGGGGTGSPPMAFPPAPDAGGGAPAFGPPDVGGGAPSPAGAPGGAPAGL